MGGAMLDGWLASGIAADAIVVADPAPNPGNATLSTPGLTITLAGAAGGASVMV
ncbi:MAG: pyrroline-5-carboxylate reductase, partial [Pseudomonadota bacterium]